MQRLLASVATALLSLAGAPLPAAAQTDQLPPAARTLSSCLQTSDRLSVLLLVDESGSLDDTDPQNHRVEGLKAAIGGLVRLTEQPGARAPKVEVLFARFSGVVHPAPESEDPVQWLPVSSATRTSLNRRADGYASRNQGDDTDYGLALAAAQSLLTTRAAQLTKDAGTAAPCKAIIWFTDGKYQLGPRGPGSTLPMTVPYAPGVRLDDRQGADQALAEGKTYLCEPGRLSDRLREEDVVLFTVALSTKEFSTGDRDFLHALTTGVSNEETCGSKLSDDNGLYLAARDGSGLFFVFSNLFSAPSPRPVDGPRSFETMTGLKGFLIGAATSADDMQATLTGPDGSSVRLNSGEAGRTEVSGATVSYDWHSQRVVEIEGRLPADVDTWIGEWKIDYLDAPVRSTIRLLPGVSPSLVDEPVLTRGEPDELRVRLVDENDAPVEAGPLAERAAMPAEIRDPNTGRTLPVTLTKAGDGTFAGTVAIPDSLSAPYVVVDVGAEFDPVGDVVINTVHRSFELQTELAASAAYPAVQTTRLDLPSIEGEGTTTGTITVVAPSEVGGCVFLREHKLSGPGRAGEIALSTEPESAGADCLTLEPGQRADIQVTLTPARAATGGVRGTVPVQLTSDQEPGTQTVEIPTSFELAPEPDIVKRWAIIALLTLAGVALPIAFLHLLNWLGAWFTAPQELKWLKREVSIDPDRRLVTRAGEPIEAPYGAFELVSSEGTGRRTKSHTFDGIALHTVASGSFAGLFKGPYGVATAATGGRLAAGPPPLHTWDDNTEHEVPVALPGTWLFYPTAVHRPREAEPTDDFGGMAEETGKQPEERARVDGNLILLIADGGDIDQGSRLVSSAEHELRKFEVEDASELGRGPDDGRFRWMSWPARRRPGRATPPPEPDDVATDDDDKDAAGGREL
jgi:hypothetical protein